MRVLVAVVGMAALVLSSCGERPAEQAPTGQATENRAGPTSGPQGPPGPEGPPGPPGSAGPPGSPGPGVRFAESACGETRCTASCAEGERILSAHFQGSGGALVYDNELTVTYRQPRRAGSVKIVLACVKV